MINEKNKSPFHYEKPQSAPEKVKNIIKGGTIRENKKQIFIIFALILVIIVLIGGYFAFTVKLPPDVFDTRYQNNLHSNNNPVPNNLVSSNGKIDDWAYQENRREYEGIMQNSANLGSGPNMWGAPSAGAPRMMKEMAADTIGLAVGGAKDVNNFRENIANNFLPLPTDITYEGLFYDYYFDTGLQKECKKLFCPSYSYAISKDPISGTDDYYLAVGLNSGIKEADFKRKKLNLTVVLDISGSMGSPFNQYYYDQFGNKIEQKQNNEDARKSKIQLASKSVQGLISHLNDDDRFGMILFNDEAYLAKPLNLIKDSDMERIKDHILEIGADGGTNMEAGMRKGTELFKKYLNINQDEYENRIIFLTDAMPNRGATDEGSLLGITQKNADNHIYATFIGIGVDFNTELIESITKIKGANYYSVHSSDEFQKRVNDEFDYMVTPLVFDLNLTLAAKGYEILKVYGSPEANEATGEIMKVNTLFPSKNEGGQTKGGLVLLKLKKLSPDGELSLITSYKDREGKADSEQEIVQMSEGGEVFQNLGVRKGVLLARYADLIKDWINDSRKIHPDPEPILYAVDAEKGISVPEIVNSGLGQWERQSMPLSITSHYKEMFTLFQAHFLKEMSIIGDDTLDQENKILVKLIEH